MTTSWVKILDRREFEDLFARTGLGTVAAAAADVPPPAVVVIGDVVEVLGRMTTAPGRDWP